MVIEYRTQDQQKKHRFQYWHEVVCRHCIPADCLPLNEQPFDGRLTVHEVGKVAISAMQAPPHQWHRDAYHLRSSPGEDLWIASMESGNGHMEQNHHQAALRDGSLVLYDSTLPFRCTMDARRVFLVRLPRQALLRRCPRAERWVGRLIDPSLPGASVLREMVQQATHQDQQANTGLAQLYGDTMLDLAALALESSLGTEAGKHKRDIYERLCRYIQDNFEDPSLNLATLAAANHVSTRTVTRAFARHDQTAMGLVWQTRLYASQETLQHGRADNVIDVALSHGFSDLSHFNRAFRHAFGCTPGSVLRRSRQ